MNDILQKKLVIGLPDSAITDYIIRNIEKIRPFGIIFFSRNFHSTEELKKIISQLRSIDGNLEFLIDQEGGEKCRIFKKPYCPPLPLDMRKWKPSAVEEAFLSSSEALAELGITINLAPVADLGTGEYIRRRTFGKNPEDVAERVAAAICGISRGGLKPCAKHFPGLGSADIDPHKSLPETDMPLEEFENKHFIPFRAAIEAKCPFMMTTHILAKSIDGKNPATYSRKIVNILRDMGFSGKIFTDDVAEMKGAEIIPARKRISAALNAGHDVVLWCSGKNNFCEENINNNEEKSTD